MCHTLEAFIFSQKVHVSKIVGMSLLLKVTAEQLYSHGDGALPAGGIDPDEPGEDGWVDVVPHRAIVIRVPNKPLDPEKKKDKERKKV